MSKRHSPGLLALRVAVAALTLGMLSAVHAQQEADDSIQYKLTFGHYAASTGNDGRDINLRGTRGSQVAWIGYYNERAGLQQWRTGVDQRFDTSFVRTVLSAQWASGGALVGSVTSEVGGPWFAIVGFGRTNVRPYVNLNFDPNDAITFGIGTRTRSGLEATVFQVRDDRLGTGQRVTHAVLRQRLGEASRLTLDLFTKSGRIDTGEQIRAKSVTITYDHDPFFIRFAHDPYAGFGSAKQNRLSGGFRF